jgi:endonuclease YncB( thermonuclease family)
VRLIGIDTPETVRPGVAVECGGKQAKDHLLRMSFRDAPQDTDGDRLMDSDGIEGRQVTLRTDPTQDRRDRYGRLLAYVALTRGGDDLAREQLRAGWATVYVYEDAFQRVRAYRTSQRRARARGLGVWTGCGGDFHRPAGAR